MTAGIPTPREVRAQGHIVGVYEYGQPDGAPVMALHGTPACGAGFTWADAAARERGLRLIAPDRAGVGLSSARPPGSVADYPAQLRDLADALGVEQYGVWGYSGGGPYAVACAARPAGRVTSVVVAAGMGQVGVWARADEFEKTDRQMVGLATNHPAVARFLLGASGRFARMSPKLAMKSFERQLNPSDLAVVATLGPPAEAMALFTQAFQHGARGVVADYAMLAQPWGVTVEDITVPVSIFHGDTDPMVPLRHSEELAARIPGAQLTVWPGAGHLGTVTYVGDVLDAVR